MTKKERQVIDIVVLKKVQCFRLQYTVFFFSMLCTSDMVQVNLFSLKLYRHDLKGNRNYFELSGGSSYLGFKLRRVKLK